MLKLRLQHIRKHLAQLSEILFIFWFLKVLQSPMGYQFENVFIEHGHEESII